MTETKTRNPFALAREHGQREASGFMARDNIEDVKWWIDQLVGDPSLPQHRRRFTKVLAYEYAGYRPEVYTGVTVDSVTLHNDGEWPAVQIVDDRAVWSLDTALDTQPTYDMLKDGGGVVLAMACYIEVSDRHLRVRLRTPEGKLAWWHLQLQA